MDENMFNTLSLVGKADFIQKQGNFVEAEDYYSYRIVKYAVDNHHVEIVYDFSNTILSVEFTESKAINPEISSQLESSLGDTLSPE
jgi:hypothetical protein